MRFRFWGVVPVLAALWLAGCSTYLGYEDIHDEVLTSQPDGEPRDVRHYAVLAAEGGSARLTCFRRQERPENTLKELRIVGRKEFYSPYEADYYFTHSPYNAGWNKDAWLFSHAGFLWPRAIKSEVFLAFDHPNESDGSRSSKTWWDTFGVGFYFLPILGQVALCFDGPVALVCTCVDGVIVVVCSCVDGTLFIGRCLWTGVSSSCAWLGGRTFGWYDDWHLREHKPSALRMASYMPFINYFAIQTPPYMVSERAYRNTSSETVRYAPGDQTVLSRTRIVRLVPEQILCAQYAVNAKVLGGGEVLGQRAFVTDDDGAVDLTELLRESVEAAPFTVRDFSLELELRDTEGERCLKRTAAFRAEHVMPIEAARDLAAYRSDDTDCLNRLLLSRRSHAAWRQQEILAGDFALPAER